MKRFIADLKQYWRDRPFVWSGYQDIFTGRICLPASGRVLVLGPHPDDPESVAITCRLLMESGCDIWYAIVSMSPSGVEDEYAQRRQNSDTASLEDKKIEIRRREQTRSAEMFGLGPDRLAFLCIEEDEKVDSPKNRARVKDHLESVAADIVIMPIGKDPNQMHAWVYRVFRKCARDLTLKTGKPILALYNEDPKTVQIREDLFLLFGEEGAEWKGELLRIHDSQQQRNIHHRGMGLDERILRMNRSSCSRLSEVSASAVLSGKYAEVFELELFEFP